MNLHQPRENVRTNSSSSPMFIPYKFHSLVNYLPLVLTTDWLHSSSVARQLECNLFRIDRQLQQVAEQNYFQ